jgi:glucuronate isomerase
MNFINDDFLLETKAARRLYEEHAASQPIFDYHCHLSPKDIALNRRFNDLFEIWLEGDHYKWRAMRANGEPERFCTGNASPYEKFLAWSRTVPFTLRNPLFHWTHLELQRYFNIAELLDSSSAPRIWEQANVLLQNELDVHGILRRFKVRVIGTTDDPADSLEFHEAIARSGLDTRVVPTFRPDACLRVDSAPAFNAWVDRLSATVGSDIDSLTSLLLALEQRQQEFHRVGSRLSDHGLDICYVDECSEKEAATIFSNARNGHSASADDHRKFASFMMLFLGRMYARSEWTMQLHLGALRNVNTRARSVHGPDTGFDTMGGTAQLNSLAKFLDLLDQESLLPRTIVYNSNPVENYPFATIAGSFSAEGIPGKIQLGSGWWFLDQKDGIELQLNALSNVGLLSRFVGMVTDSRSFMSYPRHEYFRRVLCNFLGSEMESGILPNDDTFVGSMVEKICFGNAQRYFRLPAVNEALGDANSCDLAAVSGRE